MLKLARRVNARATRTNQRDEAGGGVVSSGAHTEASWPEWWPDRADATLARSLKLRQTSTTTTLATKVKMRNWSMLFLAWGGDGNG